MEGLVDDVIRVIRPLDDEGNPLPSTTVEVKLSKEAKTNLAVGAGIFAVVNTLLLIVGFKLSS